MLTQRESHLCRLAPLATPHTSLYPSEAVAASALAPEPNMKQLDWDLSPPVSAPRGARLHLQVQPDGCQPPLWLARLTANRSPFTLEAKELP